MATNKKGNGAAAAVVILVAVGLIAYSFMNESDFSTSSDEGSYTLSLGEDFNLGAASRDDLGISVVIAVDVSGSMASSPEAGGDAKYMQASQALGEVVTVLDRILRNSPKEQIIQVGLLKFSTDVEVVQPLTALSRKGLEKLRSLATNPRTWNPDGATAIGSAVEEGTRMLIQSGTILRSLIVVTDGENTEGPEPAAVLSALYNNRNDKTTPDFPVFTSSNLVSFIGFDIGSGYFDKFKDYGARVTSASNQEELASSLSRLLEADITKLEAPDQGGNP